MKLFNLALQKQIDGDGAGEKLMATGGALVGNRLIMQSYEKPEGANLHGLIHFKLEGDKEPAEVYPIIPRMAGCVWIDDDALMASITYDNEHPLHTTLDSIFEDVEHNGNEILTIYVGEKEWGKLTASNRVQFVGKDALFKNAKLIHVLFYETALIIEHRAKVVTNED